MDEDPAVALREALLDLFTKLGVAANAADHIINMSERGSYLYTWSRDIENTLDDSTREVETLLDEMGIEHD